MIKRFLISLLVSAIVACAPIEEKWHIATAEDGGRPLIIRYRADIPDGVLPSAYPDMIAITWPFKSESGMPSQEEKQQMNILEDSISDATEPIKEAFLTIIVTGNEVCEWQFYSKNQETFMKLMNKALAGKPVFPIQVSIQKDPQWAAYNQFKKSD